jgi:hypothetical protein
MTTIAKRPILGSLSNFLSHSLRYLCILFLLGDSGGPNYFTDPVSSKRTQLGVVSWGIGCAEAGFPGVYTSVAYHYDFIRTVVCEDKRLGDFGASVSTFFSQSKPTAASPLKLCLPNDVPAPNNSGGGDSVEPIIVGENKFDNNEIQGEPVEEDAPEVPSCFTENTICKKDDECCGNLVCNKRDDLCKSPPRQYKVRISGCDTM